VTKERKEKRKTERGEQKRRLALESKKPRRTSYLGGESGKLMKTPPKKKPSIRKEKGE